VDVLHQGLAPHLGWSFGAVTALTGVVVLLLWIPLRQRPGVGTVANVVVIAGAVEPGASGDPPATRLGWQIALMVTGVLLNGVATACYVGRATRPGPRDG